MPNYYLYRAGQFLALLFPIKIAYAIAVFACDVHYIFARIDRRTVQDNLKVIFPDKSDKEIKRIRLRMFRNFAKYLVDFFRFSRVDEQYVRKHVAIVNRHYIDEALQKGKGVIAVTAHIGNWELGGVVVALSGYSIEAVALPHKDRRVNDFFNSQREEKKLRVIPFGKAAIQCIRALKDNKIIALVGDRDFSETGIPLDFFGKQSLFPPGPAAFSLKTGAVIIPGFVLRRKDDYFSLVFEKPLQYTPTGNKEEDKKMIMKQYKTIFEGYIRDFPDQWFMFRQFWLS